MSKKICPVCKQEIEDGEFVFAIQSGVFLYYSMSISGEHDYPRLFYHTRCIETFGIDAKIYACRHFLEFGRLCVKCLKRFEDHKCCPFEKEFKEVLKSETNGK